MLASAHFQDAIDPPGADFDIAHPDRWSRLGTPLPEKTQQREYSRSGWPVSSVTGTEWEYEGMRSRLHVKRRPRHTGVPQYQPDDRRRA